MEKKIRSKYTYPNRTYSHSTSSLLRNCFISGLNLICTQVGVVVGLQKSPFGPSIHLH